MRQFDVCRLRPLERGRKSRDLVVILQANLTADLGTRVVAPLVPENSLPLMGRLRPIIACGGLRYQMLADRLSVLSVKSIGVTVGSCLDREYDIRRALDMVFLGV